MADDVKKIPIKISVENPVAGTASAWVNQGEVVDTQGEVNPVFASEWAETISKVTNNTYQVYDQIPDDDKKILETYDRLKKTYERGSGGIYELVAGHAGWARSKVYNTLKKYGKVNIRSKKQT